MHIGDKQVEIVKGYIKEYYKSGRAGANAAQQVEELGKARAPPKRKERGDQAWA